MAIDTSIITDGVRMQQAIQQNNMNQLQNLGGNLGQIVLGRRINQMRQITNPDEQQAFANKSIFSPFLNDTLRADRAAAAKAAADLARLILKQVSHARTIQVLSGRRF